MDTPSISLAFLLCVFLVIISCFGPVHAQSHGNFLQCLSFHNHSAISRLVYTPSNSSYLSILQSSIQNLRFTSPSTPRPLVIVTPLNESQVPAVVLCSKQTGLQIRTRSGGHDYEGLSYTSHVPFVVVDLINLSKVTIDLECKTAWVQAGATIGQLDYRIGQDSKTLAFPAGVCPTVGVGGHFSGGGFGFFLRKYGLAADNVIDARLVEANGKILDRKAMGEDLFWAIRGGGGASFGVITAWKLNLVTVPETITRSSVNKTLEQNATQLIHKWQFVAPNLPKDLLIELLISKVNSSKPGETTIQAIFNLIFLGRVERLLELLRQRFPELGVKKEDCIEVSWIQSAVVGREYPIGASPEVLANRTASASGYFKAKSDYVREPIPEYGLRGIWKFLYEEGGDTATLIFIPFGGRMEEISESAIPFPHRAGNLYKIQYLVSWDEVEMHESNKYINWIRRLYGYMTPYVSKNPRRAYLNYGDLDLGVNNAGNTSYAQARVWGARYFNRNFDRLVRVKTEVDASNFFRNEQSIPSVAV